MVDYFASLKADLVEQFKGQPNIEAVMEVIAEQLQDVADFYEDLRTQRSISTAVGSQLDGVGDIVVLSRAEAGELSSFVNPGEPINDETYRKYLFYKVLKNTNTCTYPDLIRAFRMFWEKPLYYHEDPEYPAVMFLDAGILSPEDHAENLLSAPIIKAAGVGIHITATTESPPMESELHVTPVMGRGMAITKLPELEPELPAAVISVVPVIGRGLSITKLPVIEPDLGIAVVVGHASAAMVGTIMETRLPTLKDFDTEIQAATVGRFSAASHGTIMETRLPELKEEFA